MALGLAAGAAPDRFLVGLAALRLLAEVAEAAAAVRRGRLQWLDEASAQVLGFVARRLLAEPVAIVFGVRGPSGSAARGAAGAALEGLDHEDARALLATASPAGSTTASASGSSPRRAATRSRCWSCRAR